jgi:hypothetical protein
MNNLKESFDSKTYKVFRGLCKDVPNWSDFIENFNYNYSKDKNKYNEKKDPRFITDNILLYNKFDPVIFNCIEDQTTSLFLKSLEAAKQIKGLMDKDANGIKSIINFLGNEQDYWVHSDNHDVISWHCIGEIEWRFYKNVKEEDLHKTEIEDAEYESVVLQPGDVLYVPSGVFHQVINNKPRASLVFAYYE